jgi:hypothetical protein
MLGGIDDPRAQKLHRLARRVLRTLRTVSVVSMGSAPVSTHILDVGARPLTRLQKTFSAQRLQSSGSSRPGDIPVFSELSLAPHLSTRRQIAAKDLIPNISSDLQVFGKDDLDLWHVSTIW